MRTRVLVVDDEETIRRLIAQVLEETGYDVVQASSGEKGLELYRLDPFQLIVTDIYMDKMTGLDLLKEVKTLDPDVLVVVITSNASLETAMDALRAGAYDYLIKPFEDIEMISPVVNRARDHAKLASSNRALMEYMRRNALELERINVKLTDRANRDELTGLSNHRFFRETLNKELARSKRHDRTFSLIFMDIDHFKNYNDSHGHLAGDELLKEVGRILDGECRESTMAARYGGEEFVLLLPETDRDGAEATAERMRQKVEQHKFTGRETQPLGCITLSMGVATFPESGTESTMLLDHADKALYQSKRGGRNRVSVWEPVKA